MDSKIFLIFELLLLYQLKQWLCDFVLQSKYMLNKGNGDISFLKPLALHCLTHGLGTLLIVMLFTPNLWWLSVFDFVVHFMIDRIKSGPKYLGRFNDTTKNSFWIILGLDQMAHHLTHLFIIYLMVL